MLLFLSSTLLSRGKGKKAKWIWPSTKQLTEVIFTVAINICGQPLIIIDLEFYLL